MTKSLTVDELAKIVETWPRVNAKGEKTVVILAHGFPEIPGGHEEAVATNSSYDGQHLVLFPRFQPIPDNFVGGSAGVIELALLALEHLRLEPLEHDPDTQAKLVLRALTAIYQYKKLESAYDKTCPSAGQFKEEDFLPSQSQVLLDELENIASQAYAVASELRRIVATGRTPESDLGRLDRITGDLESAAELTRNLAPLS